MLKLVGKAGLIGIALMFAQGAAAQLGPQAAVCRAGQPSILVNVYGFQARTGRVRVQLYHANGEFLAHGRYLQRIDLPVTGGGAMPVCVPVPQPGRYAIAVRHDVNGDNQSRDWNDGAGFSRNPSLSLLHLQPDVNDVAVTVGRGVLAINVVLNYRYGLSVHPVRG